MVKFGSLFVLKQSVHLHRERPIFPWDKLMVSIFPDKLMAGTKCICIGYECEKNSIDKVEVLVDDGRRGWIFKFQIKDSIVAVNE